MKFASNYALRLRYQQVALKLPEQRPAKRIEVKGGSTAQS
jgi:hypothetical protein